MHPTKFNELIQRCRALKKAIFESSEANQITASVDQAWLARLREAKARLSKIEGGLGSRPATTPDATKLSTEPKSVEELLLEINAAAALGPHEETRVWRELYPEIQRARQREAYARANRPRNKFLNMEITGPVTKI